MKLRFVIITALLIAGHTADAADWESAPPCDVPVDAPTAPDLDYKADPNLPPVALPNGAPLELAIPLAVPTPVPNSNPNTDFADTGMQVGEARIQDGQAQVNVLGNIYGAPVPPAPQTKQKSCVQLNGR